MKGLVIIDVGAPCRRWEAGDWGVIHLESWTDQFSEIDEDLPAYGFRHDW